MEELCDVCDAKTRQMCSGCNLAIYCSEKCQAQHWEDHQDVCYIACGAEKMEEEEADDDDEEDPPEGDAMAVDSDIHQNPDLIGFLRRRQMIRRKKFGMRSANAARRAKKSTGLKKTFYKAKSGWNRRKGGIANKKAYQ